MPRCSPSKKTVKRYKCRRTSPGQVAARQCARLAAKPMLAVQAMPFNRLARTLMSDEVRRDRRVAGGALSALQEHVESYAHELVRDALRVAQADSPRLSAGTAPLTLRDLQAALALREPAGCVSPLFPEGVVVKKVGAAAAAAPAPAAAPVKTAPKKTAVKVQAAVKVKAAVKGSKPVSQAPLKKKVAKKPVVAKKKTAKK